MNADMHGKKIKTVTWPDSGEDLGRCIQSGSNGDISLSSDHDELWIIQIKDGVEIARHNVRYVESIVWDIS